MVIGARAIGLITWDRDRWEVEIRRIEYAVDKVVEEFERVNFYQGAGPLSLPDSAGAGICPPSPYALSIPVRAAASSRQVIDPRRSRSLYGNAAERYRGPVHSGVQQVAHTARRQYRSPKVSIGCQPVCCTD